RAAPGDRGEDSGQRGHNESITHGGVLRLEVAQRLTVLTVTEPLEGDEVDRVADEPHRPVAEHRVDAAAVRAARRDDAQTPVVRAARAAVAAGRRVLPVRRGRGGQ